jgi:hypothetical protein
MVQLPQVDSRWLSDTMSQWKSFWIMLAAMAGGIAVLFSGFWDTSVKNGVSEGDAVTAGGREEHP